MKVLSLLLFLALFRPAFAQDAAGASNQPPKDLDEGLRARVTRFYQSFIAGKFNEAYTMVAPEAQNDFIEQGKAEYKECETVKIDYSDNFTKATVNDTCKGEWHWEGHVSPAVLSIVSHWKLVDNQWYWYYVKPKTVPNPFAPNGVTVLPDEPDTKASNVSIPKDMHIAALNILNKVRVDKNTVTLRADSVSKDEVQVRNDMPGEVNLVLAPSPLAGLKVTASKTRLKANESSVLTVEYSPDDKSIACGDCASRIRRAWVQLTIEPTGQVFQIEVAFTNQKSEQFPLPK